MLPAEAGDYWEVYHTLQEAIVHGGHATENMQRPNGRRRFAVGHAPELHLECMDDHAVAQLHLDLLADGG